MNKYELLCAMNRWILYDKKEKKECLIMSIHYNETYDFEYLDTPIGERFTLNGDELDRIEFLIYAKKVEKQ